MIYDTKPYDDDNKLQFDLAPRYRFSRPVRRPQLSTVLRWGARNNRIRVPYGTTDTMLRGVLTSRLGGVDNPRVIIDARRSASEPWRARGRASTDYYNAGGVYWRWEAPATASMQFRMRYGGTRAYKPSRSAALHVDVSMNVTATMQRSGVARGNSVSVTGRVAPAQPGSAVALQRRMGSSWKTVTTGTVLPGGSYSLSTTPRSSGDLVYRVRHGGDALRVPGYSRPMTLRVYSAAITRVVPSTPQRELNDLNSEYVIVKNTGRVPVSLAGWFIEANLADWSSLPTADLAPGQSVRVHSGAGRSRSGHVYLNRRVPMWPAAGVARLYDEHEDVVHERRYGM